MVVLSTATLFGKFNLVDLNWETRKYNAQPAYGDSKVANHYSAYELARRLVNGGIIPKSSQPKGGY